MISKTRDWFVVVWGSLTARKRWSNRSYVSRSSARRRVRQIDAARDSGVALIRAYHRSAVIPGKDVP